MVLKDFSMGVENYDIIILPVKISVGRHLRNGAEVFANAREDFEVNVLLSSVLLDPFHEDNG